MRTNSTDDSQYMFLAQLDTGTLHWSNRLFMSSLMSLETISQDLSPGRVRVGFDQKARVSGSGSGIVRIVVLRLILWSFV